MTDRASNMASNGPGAKHYIAHMMRQIELIKHKIQ